MNRKNYWFADCYSDVIGDEWIPTLQLGNAVVVPMDIHFTSKQNCLDWMYEELIDVEVRDD